MDLQAARTGARKTILLIFLLVALLPLARSLGAAEAIALHSAPIEAYCSSFRIESGSLLTGDTIYFTGATYTNAPSAAGLQVSGEFRPVLSGSGSVYESKWLVPNPKNYFGSLPSSNPAERITATNGSIRLKFPSADTNQNLIPDWMERGIASPVPVSGTLSPFFRSGGSHWQGTQVSGELVKPSETNSGALNLTLVTSWRTQNTSTNVTLLTNWLSCVLEIPYLSGFLRYDRSLLSTGMSLNLASPNPQLPGVEAEGVVLKRARGRFMAQITNLVGSWKAPNSTMELFATGSRTNARSYIGNIYALGAASTSDGFAGTNWRDFTDWSLHVQIDSDSDANGFSDLTDGPPFPDLVFIYDVKRSGSSLELTVATMSVSSQEVWVDRSDDLINWTPLQSVLIYNPQLINLDPEFVREHLLPVKRTIVLPTGPGTGFYRVF